MTEKTATHDIIIGQQLRLYRQANQLTQKQLAQAVGISAQQIQKYENGTNRLTISRLIDISNTMNMSLLELLHPFDMDSKGTGCENTINKEGLRLLKNYHSIRKHKIKTLLAELIKLLGEDD